MANGAKVHVIKSAKYGANVFLAIGYTDVTFFNFLPPWINAADTMQIMLVSPSGTVVTPLTNLSPFSLSPSDDWRVLSDGTVVWTYVTFDGSLKLYRLPIQNA